MTQKKAPGKIDQVTVLTNPVDISSFINAVKKTIVLFEMTGCPYCRAFEPRFFDQVDRRPGDCQFLRARLDDHHNPLWQKYEIIAVPTVIVFSAGLAIARADSVLGLGLSKKKWSEFCTWLI